MGMNLRNFFNLDKVEFSIQDLELPFEEVSFLSESINEKFYSEDVSEYSYKKVENVQYKENILLKNQNMIILEAA
ncbi:hypothetical protein [Streptococcus parauberis]|uniref:hypothetical protein n=1 Tax=Streptococcus parauberis TaxID=1348 RepID=UPI0037B27910